MTQGMRREVQGKLRGFHRALKRPLHEREVIRRAELGAKDPRKNLRPVSAELFGLPLEVKAAKSPGKLGAHVHGAADAALRRLDPPPRERPSHAEFPALVV